MSISFSKYSKYVLCPKMYDYHYNEKLRPKGTSSALVFGSLIDEALNSVLLGEEESYPLQISADVTFMPNDYDPEILLPTQVEVLTEEATALGYEGDDVLGMISRLFERQLDAEELSPKQWQVLSLAIGMSLIRKAQIIVEAYRLNVMPLIEKVHGVQVKAGPGFIDLVADVKGYGKVVLDNKTASRPYDRNAVATAVQLATYADEIGCDKAGFIVIQKVLKKNRIKICKTCEHDGSGGRHKTCDAKGPDGKRCGGEWNEWIRPEAVIDIIIDDVPERTKEVSKQAFLDVEKGVKAKVFPRNLNQCKYVFGKPCPYFDKCWNDSDEGLENK